MTHLQRCDRDTNCFRFWQIEVAPDLFGTWCVTRSWGRIGAAGRQQILSHPDPASACATAQRLVAAKHRRGYRGA